MKILTQTQIDILMLFSKVKNSDSLYLTGGTALSAFFLFHRLSEDLDFFTGQENLLNSFTEDLIRELKKQGYEVNLSRSYDTFKELFIEKKGELPPRRPAEIVKIHLAQDSPFRFEKPVKTKYGIMLDSFIDVITNKMLALFGRYFERDYVDIYFAVKEKKIDFRELLKKTREKDPGADEYYLAIAFEKIKEVKKAFKNIKLLKPLDQEEIKKFYLACAREILKK